MNYILEYFEQYLPLSSESQEKIKDCVVTLSLSKGTILIGQGKSNHYLYVIREGIVRGFLKNGKQETTVSLLKENEAFGDVSTYMTLQPAIKSYQLLEDSILYRIDQMKFRRLFLIDHEICNLGRIIAEQHILFLQKSIKQYNGMTALEKYECFLRERPDLIFRVKFIYIASYLHMAPETLSRIHSRWLKERNSSLNISLSEWQAPTGS